MLSTARRITAIAFAALSLACAHPVGMVRVAVVQEEHPVEGLFVTIFSPEHHSVTARTDADGNVVFRVPAGEWRVRLETGREESQSPPVHVRSDWTASILVPLDATIRCRIRWSTPRWTCAATAPDRYLFGSYRISSRARSIAVSRPRYGVAGGTA